jgi:3-methyladenine DNA glycosylase AlkD
MHSYIEPLVELYSANRNDMTAVPMAKYMKDKFPFLGLKTPARKELNKVFFRQYGLPEITELERITGDLWSLPEREYQYFALGLLRKMIKKLPKEFISLFEDLIVEKSWWDTVDGIASWFIGEHFKRFPELKNSYIEKWMRSDNIWLQRTCLLFQLEYKSATDTDLLVKLIRELEGSKEFFINKAIGWILREYSKTNSAFVIDFAEKTDLAPLSRREALKWLINKNLYKEKG